jgi:DNA-binding NarL/FixJ family response regulator
MNRQRYRVVLVDDDVDVRALARRYLERSGRFAVVAEAGDGARAVTVAAEHQPDLTLLDLHMPGTDGLTALPRIRAVAPSSTVVVLSGLQQPHVEEDAMAAGASGFLSKQPGWDRLPEDLLSLLESLEIPETFPAKVRQSRLELPAALTSGHNARRFLRATLKQWGLAAMVEDAELLTSELVNNAVVHATSSVMLRLRLDRHRLRIEVADTGEGALHRKRAAVSDTSGRGLLLVDALSSSWGTSANPEGKVVWFELDTAR